MESSMLLLSDGVLLNIWEKGTHPRRCLFEQVQVALRITDPDPTLTCHHHRPSPTTCSLVTSCIRVLAPDKFNTGNSLQAYPTVQTTK